MSIVRLRRLQADHEKLKQYTKLHPRVAIVQADGAPPERYQISYRIRSLRQNGEELVESRDHLVEIALPRNYPRAPPLCRMLTPIFHPNIAPHAICVGDHWSVGESLQSLVARIGEMIAYQSYNTKSPLNGEAARWADQNQTNLPLDAVSMLVEEPAPRAPVAAPVAAATPARPSAALAAPGRQTAPSAGVARTPSRPATAARPNGDEAGAEYYQCGCGGRFRVPSGSAGKRVRCPRCNQVGTVGGAP